MGIIFQYGRVLKPPKLDFYEARQTQTEEQTIKPPPPGEPLSSSTIQITNLVSFGAQQISAADTGSGSFNLDIDASLGYDVVIRSVLFSGIIWGGGANLIDCRLIVERGNTEVYSIGAYISTQTTAPSFYLAYSPQITLRQGDHVYLRFTRDTAAAAYWRCRANIQGNTL